ncbi:hypothetical protein OF829_08990 [Sphingomonas sp. LB-2]|nr:hypothetical protein [Sphingomonas caeni]
MRPFRLAADQPQPRDKDNVQRVPPPPRTVFIPHPQLAPPGMAGSRLAAEAKRWMEARKFETPDRGEKREFKPLVRSPDKSRTRDR